MKVELTKEQIRDILDTYLRKYNTIAPRLKAATEYFERYAAKGEVKGEWAYDKFAKMTSYKEEKRMVESILEALEEAYNGVTK